VGRGNLLGRRWSSAEKGPGKERATEAGTEKGNGGHPFPEKKSPRGVAFVNRMEGPEKGEGQPPGSSFII